MKNTINYFLLPAAAMLIVAIALHTFIPYSQVYNVDMCNTIESNTIFALLGFLFGFLPCLISAMAKDALKLIPAITPQPEATNQVIYVGQVFSATNCQFRVKSLKTISQNLN